MHAIIMFTTFSLVHNERVPIVSRVASVCRPQATYSSPYCLLSTLVRSPNATAYSFLATGRAVAAELNGPSVFIGLFDDRRLGRVAILDDRFVVTRYPGHWFSGSQLVLLSWSCITVKRALNSNAKQNTYQQASEEIQLMVWSRLKF
jgi:hypothetical protein